jgi:hypothetical protein
MSEERELLWRIQQVLQCERDDYGFVGEIENLLAQPEQEPSDTEIITAYQMLVRRKLGLPEKNEVLQLGEPEFKVCVNKIDGVCPLHNLHCNYPECEK